MPDVLKSVSICGHNSNGGCWKAASLTNWAEQQLFQDSVAAGNFGLQIAFVDLAAQVQQTWWLFWFFFFLLVNYTSTNNCSVSSVWGGGVGRLLIRRVEVWFLATAGCMLNNPRHWSLMCSSVWMCTWILDRQHLDAEKKSSCEWDRLDKALWVLE